MHLSKYDGLTMYLSALPRISKALVGLSQTVVPFTLLMGLFIMCVWGGGGGRGEAGWL